MRLMILASCLASASSLVAVPGLSLHLHPGLATSGLSSLTEMPAQMASLTEVALRKLALTGRAHLARGVLSRSWHQPETGIPLADRALSAGGEHTAGFVCRALFPVYWGAVCAWHSARAEWATQELQRAQALLAAALAPHAIEYAMAGRVKSLLSLFEKSVLKGKVVTDLIGLRIIVPDECGLGECYRVGHTIAALWPEGRVHVKDFISAPKRNGYQSLHLLVQTARGTRIEVQVRTMSMHHTAEHGSAAHAMYKARAAQRLVFATRTAEGVGFAR